MDKQFSEGKMFYKIGELCEVLDVNASLLRFWEKEFTELSPKKNGKGERLYSKKDIELIQIIHYLVKEQGYTLPGAKTALKSRKKLEEKIKAIQKLQEVKNFLNDVKKRL